MELIIKVAKRICELNACGRTKFDWIMDIEIAHKSIPLNLQRLIKSDDFNFSHDVFGIARNLNRVTGKLENCFIPRYAKK